MAQTTSLVFNGGVIPSPSPAPSGSGKAKLLKIGEITVTEQEVQVTKNVICDPDSVTTVAPFMEVLTSARLAELISANNILVLDDGTMQYLMSDSTIAVENGTAVCTAVNFLGLSKENRAKVLYPCTRLIDELTLQQVIEVGEPVEIGFDLVKAYPEDTEAGTLIDKLEIEDTIDDDPDYQPLLAIVPTDGKVAINEDNLHEAIEELGGAIDNIAETIDGLDVDSVPHAYLGSTLFQSAGDSVTTGTPIDVFSCTVPLVGDCFEFEQTTTIDDTPFGYIWIEPGTYLINASVTLQWVGNPRGTFVAKIGKVMGENVDFSQEQELLRSTTRIVTIPNRMKLSVNITYDAGTPVMGFWIQSMQVVKLAGGMSQTNVAHDSTLTGQGSVADPLGVNTQNVAQATLAGNLAPTFDPSKNYVKYELVIENGKLCMFTANHSGTWNPSNAVEIPANYFLDKVLSNNSRVNYSGNISRSTYTLINGLYKAGDVISITIRSSAQVNVACKDFDNNTIIVKVYGSGNIDDSFRYALPQDVKSFGLYLYTESATDVFLEIDSTLKFNVDNVCKAMLGCTTANNFVEKEFSLQTGKYVRYDNGNLRTEEVCSYTDFIRVQPGDKIVVHCNINDVGNMVACYDVDYSYIQSASLRGTGSTYDGVFIIPNGVAYIRCSAITSDTSSFKSVPTIDLETTLGNSFLKAKDYEEKEFTLQAGNYIRYDNGNARVEPSCSCSDFIEVKPGDKIRVYCNINDVANMIACYDVNREYVQASSLRGTGYAYDGVFTIPAGVAYIRCSAITSATPYAPYFATYPIKSFSPKNGGLKLLVFGDSITEDFDFSVADGYTTSVSQLSRHNWSVRCNVAMNFSELRNYAKYGASYKDQSFGSWNRLSVAEQVMLSINDKDNPNHVWLDDSFVPDIIVFAAGINDRTPNDTPESAFSKIVYSGDGSVDADATLNALDRSKFCEAVMWSFLKIRIEFPYSLGLCVLPIHNAIGISIGGLHSALKALAERFGFAVINGASESGIIEENNKNRAPGNTLSDGVHPNEFGKRMMTRMMLQAIDRYYYPISIL